MASRQRSRSENDSICLTKQEVMRNAISRHPSFTLSTYGSVGHFIDIQFGLLKNKVFGSFHSAINECQNKFDETRGIIPLTNGYLLRGGKVCSKSVKLCGTVYTIVLKVSSGSCDDLSKYLLPDTMVCMSHDMFGNFMFTQVIRCEKAEPPSHECHLEIIVDRGLESKVKKGQLYDILVIDNCYAFYLDMLKRLKLFTEENFPIGEKLLNPQIYETRMHRSLSTENWKAEKSYMEDESGDQKIMCMIEMAEKQKHLDKHQAQAVRVALTNQIAVIEGYPGTGKTFLCCDIIRWLLTTSGDKINSPILFLCKTEKCLDHQMECLLSFTDNIVRAGGKCTSEILTNFTLSNRRKSIHCDTNRKPPKQENCKVVQRGRTTSHPLSKSVVSVKGKSKFGGSGKLLTKSTGDLRAKSDIYDKELFYDDEDKKSFIHDADHLRQSERRINELKDTLRQLKSSPLSQKDTVHLIVPRDTMCILLRQPKGIESAQKRKSGETKIQEKDALIKWLCLTQMDMDYVFENMEFIMEVLNLCQGIPQLSSQVNLQHYNSKFELLQKHEKLLQEIFNPDSKIFSIDILEKAALNCFLKNKSAVIPKNMWQMPLINRFENFKKWRQDALNEVKNELIDLKKLHEEQEEMKNTEKREQSIMCTIEAGVIGMTFGYAVQHTTFLMEIAPQTVIVEESDEVLESEIVASLPLTTQHLVVIGNAGTYSASETADINPFSLFARLKQCGTPNCFLRTQHRMSHEISEFLFPARMKYSQTVLELMGVQGVSNNLFLLDHQERDDTSKSNSHEAKFLLNFVTYLYKMGQESENVTILTSSIEQRQLMKELSKNCSFEFNIFCAGEFRGKESDVVLLSLSSDFSPENNFQILLSSMTRARKGFFCIGNFTSKNCPVWSNFLISAKAQECYGDVFLLKCINHPEICTAVSSYKDFKNIRSSGCSRKCPKTEQDKNK